MNVANYSRHIIRLLVCLTMLSAGGNALALTIDPAITLGENVPPQVVLPDPDPPPKRAFEGDITHVSEFELDLAPGALVSLETANCTVGANPVIHLINSSNDRQVAFNDNGDDGVNANIQFHTGNSGGKFIIIVRARSQESNGRCDLLFSGFPWKTDVPVGGWHVELDGLRQNESIETVRLPNGAGSGHRLYILRLNDQGIDVYQRDGSIGGAAKILLENNLGKRTVVVGIPQNGVTGLARLLRNDAALSGHDSDNDGLGIELEKSLGTCPTRGGVASGTDGVPFNCELIADARDTDGDGIPDGWEVLGRRHTWEREPNVRIHEDVALPLWGANPRHKDLFIEVDFMRRCGDENQTQNTQMMTASAARNFAKIYTDGVLLDANILSENARILRNPDGEPGISLHLDTGRNPILPEDVAIYGDWGGFNAVDAIESTDPEDNFCTFNGIGWKGEKASSAWRTNLSPARLGIFRYSMGYGDGGGSCGVGFSCAFNFNASIIPAHEIGHTMALGHSGPNQATGDIDPQCKPNYASIMNYAFSSFGNGFSDGTTSSAPALNNWQLTEWNGVSPAATSFLNILETRYRYYVDHEQGHVDWDRNGVIAPAGQTVRAYANFKPGTSCEYTRYNQTIIPKSASTQSPALVRLHDRLYVFFSVLGIAQYNVSTSSWDCPVPAKDGCGNSSWAPSSARVDMDAQGGIDAERYKVGSQAEVVVVTIDGSGKLWERRLSVNSNGLESWSPAQQISGSSAAAGEPTLARVDACVVHLAYRGADGMLRTNRMSCASKWRWEGEQMAQASTESNIQLSSNASPAIIRAYLPWQQTSAQLYGAFTSVAGDLDIWMFNSENGRWELTNVIQERARKVKGRPAMAWVPFQTGSEHLGRFYLTYISDQRSKYPDEIYMQMSYVKVTKILDGSLQREGKVGLNSPFDNVWYKGWGIDLLYEPGVDTNLRFVNAIKLNNDENNFRLVFRPKADGINDFTYVNYNDWETLRPSLCRQVVNPGGLVENPVVCD